MEDPLVSVIVPIYNTREYIGRCLDSIISQDYGNLEILAVDDGSTDGSADILDEYQRNDGRIRVFHREHAGVSAARNLALKMAEGEFIEFADSDDWLPQGAVSIFVQAVQQTGCDMVIADFYRVMGDNCSVKGDIEEDKVMGREELAAYIMENSADIYYGALWNKFYRRLVIENNQVRMNEKMSFCEDFLFNLEYIRYSGIFCAVKQPVYYYFNRKDSLVMQYKDIRNCVKMKIELFGYYNEFYKDVYGDNYDEVKRKVRHFLISHAKDFY